MGGQQDCTLRTRAAPKAGPVGRTSVQQARHSWRVWDHVGWSLRKKNKVTRETGACAWGSALERHGHRGRPNPLPRPTPPPLSLPYTAPCMSVQSNSKTHIGGATLPNPPHPSPLLPHSLLKPQPGATTTHQSSPPAPASPPASPPRPATHLSLSTCAHTHPPRRHGGRYTLGCPGRACPYRGPPPLPPPHQPHPSPTRRRP